MKKMLFLCIAMSMLLGCSLIPKKVEYFQKKVRPVPEVTKSAIEHQRQAAQYVEVKTEEVKVAALKESASTNILVPAAEAHGAAAALTGSLGPAEKPFVGPVSNLVQILHKDQAAFNEKLEAYRDKVEPDVGKKIEGTGTFQFGYFTNLLLVVGIPALLILLIWTGLKIYGTINPAVGLGVNTVGRVASSVLSRGVAEVVAGGERFKAYLKTSHLGEDAKRLVDDLFTRAHQEAQSQDVQALVTGLTRQAGAEFPTSAPVTIIPATAASQVLVSTPAGVGSMVSVLAGGTQVTVNQVPVLTSLAGATAAPAAQGVVATPSRVSEPGSEPQDVCVPL